MKKILLLLLLFMIVISVGCSVLSSGTNVQDINTKEFHGAYVMMPNEKNYFTVDQRKISFYNETGNYFTTKYVVRYKSENVLEILYKARNSDFIIFTLLFYKLHDNKIYAKLDVERFIFYYKKVERVKSMER